MKRITNVLLVGLLALAFTACGGGSGGSSSPGTGEKPTTPTPPSELPIGTDGNIQILPGYIYTTYVDTFVMYVKSKGRITFTGNYGSVSSENGLLNIFDANLNHYPVNAGNGVKNRIFLEHSYKFEPGLYYLQRAYEGDSTFEVKSNVL